MILPKEKKKKEKYIKTKNKNDEIYGTTLVIGVSVISRRIKKKKKERRIFLVKEIITKNIPSKRKRTTDLRGSKSFQKGK